MSIIIFEPIGMGIIKMNIPRGKIRTKINVLNLSLHQNQLSIEKALANKNDFALQYHQGQKDAITDSIELFSKLL